MANNPIIIMSVSLQKKNFVNKTSAEVIEYLSCSTEIDGVEIILCTKDRTSKQLLERYYAKKSLEKLTAPSK